MWLPEELLLPTLLPDFESLTSNLAIALVPAKSSTGGAAVFLVSSSVTSSELPPDSDESRWWMSFLRVVE